MRCRKSLKTRVLSQNRGTYQRVIVTLDQLNNTLYVSTNGTLNYTWHEAKEDVIIGCLLMQQIHCSVFFLISF